MENHDKGPLSTREEPVLFNQPSLKKTNKSLVHLLELLILIAGLVTSLLLVGQVQDMRKKAQEITPLDTATEKSNEIATELSNQLKANIKTQRSSKYGYQIIFDPSVWIGAEGTDLSTPEEVKLPDLEKLSLVLAKPLGNATMTLFAYTLSPELSTDLDLLSVYLEKNNQLGQGQGIRPVSKEKISRGGKDYYKYIYKESFLGEDSEYYEYLTLANGFYYSIIVKYPQIEETKNLSEALVDAITFFPSQSAVQGVSTAGEEDSVAQEARVVEQVKPSVVNILYLYCNTINVSGDLKAIFLQPKYSYCSSSKGSGFIVSAKGFIATNGHVVKSYPEESVINTILKSSNQLFLVDLVRELSWIKSGKKLSSIEAEEMYSKVLVNPLAYNSFVNLFYQQLDKGMITINQDDAKYFVKLGNEPIILDQTKLTKEELLSSVSTSTSIKEAELVDFDYPNRSSADVILRKAVTSGSDVAIIKIKDTDNLSFPSLKLARTISDLKVGSSLLVIGFPAIVEGVPSGASFFDYSSSVEPSVTRGIVSAIRRDQGGKKLIQTDASIERGNSGGPAISSDGEVVGLATYGFSSTSGNYNLLRDIQDIRTLLRKNNIDDEISQSSTNWSEGLRFFWLKQYTKSLSFFQKVKDSYPIHPLVEGYIADAKTSIERGEDKGILPIRTIVLGTAITIGISAFLLLLFYRSRSVY